MSTPFYLPPVPLADWQKQFGAACDERAWGAAARLVARRPHDFAAMVMLNAFSTTVAEFVVEAPAYALKLSHLPGSLDPTPAWRSATVGQLIREHLECARGALSKACLNLAHGHLAAAIQLRPRTRAQEVIVTAVLTEASLTLGQMESALAAERPDLECNPQLASPHPEDFRRSLAEEYHPAFLPSLLSLGVEIGASTAFLDLGMRMMMLHAHWPTWRALAAALPTEMYALRISARNVLQSEENLTLGANAFLMAFVKGASFTRLAPSAGSDDVLF